MSKEDAESFVENGLYKTIYRMVNVDNDIRLGEEEYIEMFGRSLDNKSLHNDYRAYTNDIYILDGANNRFKVGTPAYNMSQIIGFVKQHNVSFWCQVSGSDYYGPSLKKNEGERPLAYVYVQKKWTVDGKTTMIYDTVSVDLQNRSIAGIRNGIISLQDLPEEILDGMMAKAAGWYDRACRLDKWWRFSKRKEAKPYYNKAFVLYEKALKEDPNNDDAWYSLGVMYYKNQGVGNLSRKQRLQMAYDCWKKSNLKKACRAISFITDGREGC